MGRKNRRRQSDNVYRIGYGGMMVPYKLIQGYQFTHTLVSPEKIYSIAEQIFGGRYYCVGDRKKAGKSIENPKD